MKEKVIEVLERIEKVDKKDYDKLFELAIELSDIVWAEGSEGSIRFIYIAEDMEKHKHPLCESIKKIAPIVVLLWDDTPKEDKPRIEELNKKFIEHKKNRGKQNGK